MEPREGKPPKIEEEMERRAWENITKPEDGD